MTDARLRITAAGPHATVQDGGRPGLMRFGVPASGPMDRLAHAAANVALGNPAGAPAIEVSPGGLTVECRAGSVAFAVAGGGFVLDHAGQRGGSWCVGQLAPGETLAIRRGHWGSWCYLAFAGRLEAPHWLGSAATHAMSGFGGGAVAPGRDIAVAHARAGIAPRAIPCPVMARPNPAPRVTIGPQDRFFGAEALADFRAGPWAMTDAWDRMGVRLAGPRIAPEGPLDMPSEPIARGAVQVGGDGRATVLLADHQTTGGYPKIATVLDCDLDAFVQLRPGDRVAFRPVTAAAAITAARQAAAARGHWLAALARTVTAM